MTKSILFHIPISHPNPFDYKKQKTKNKKKNSFADRKWRWAQFLCKSSVYVHQPLALDTI